MCRLGSDVIGVWEVGVCRLGSDIDIISVWEVGVCRLGNNIISVWVVDVMNSWEVCEAVSEGVGSIKLAHWVSSLK